MSSVNSPQIPNRLDLETNQNILELELLKTNKVVIWLENEVKKLKTRFEELS